MPRHVNSIISYIYKKSVIVFEKFSVLRGAVFDCGLKIIVKVPGLCEFMLRCCFSY